MNKNDLRIVFFGTPEFAVESLDRIVKEGYNVVGVITAPDKPAGRGHKMLQSDVKQYAVEHGLNLLQPVKLKDESFINELKSLNANLQIVIAFRMLPQVIWEMPSLGTFNLHASLLPKYRGAAPINWAIINGETETGVTTFFLNDKIDTGDIIMQQQVPINRDDNVGTLYDKLMKIGSGVVLETINEILQGSVKRESQSMPANLSEKQKVAPKIFTETCRINWNDDAEQVYNFIRGLSPYPAAWTELTTQWDKVYHVKIFSSGEPIASDTIQKPGEITFDSHHLYIACNDAKLEIKALQLAGKKRMEADAFLRGFNLDKAKVK